jgi:hypothetical protein
LPRLLTTVDFSRRPNEKERALLRTRRARLDDIARSAENATANMRTLAESGGLAALRVRHPFVRMSAPRSRPPGTPGRGDPSDRRLPDRKDRPPASRIMTPRGAALRFYLTALFEAQAKTRPGLRPGNNRPLQAGGDTISWTDLLASPAKAAGGGKTYMSVSAKKARQVKNALASLASEEEELVELTRAEQPGNKYEKFRLLNEGGHRERGPNPAYQVPLDNEPAFPVPVTLFTSAWIHLLEDTELLFILMLAALHHESGGRPVKIDGDTRLLRYGLGRDAYEAHIMLSRLGLVTVAPDPGRDLDGTVEGYNDGEQALLHAFTFHPDQFSRDAQTELRTQIDYQLNR